jgi:hypothetical protein
MPRYFFHVHDGQDFPDDEGTVLANTEAARKESMVAAAEMLRDAALNLWTGEEWTMNVVDETGQPIFNLKFSASIEAVQAPIDL